MNLSLRVSVCGSRRQHSGQGSFQCLAKKDPQSQVGNKADEVLSPAGQSTQQPMAREISMTWSSTLVYGAQLFQQWSGACLSYTLKVLYSTLLGLFGKCLGILDAKWGISPGAYLWVVPLCSHGCSDHMCRYLRCVSLPDVSALLGSFPLEPKCHGWLTAILVNISDSTLF